jgi:MATE family multidrug resistance protein
MSIRQQIRSVLALALLLIAAELGWMFMGIVDNIMVGTCRTPPLSGRSSSTRGVQDGQEIIPI